MTEMAAALIRLRDERFGGNATALAKAFGISHPYLSHLLSGRVGAGKKLCRAYAAFTGTSIDEAFRMAEGPAADPAACEHPNEAPHVCPCPPGCYCKTRACRGAVPIKAPVAKPTPSAVRADFADLFATYDAAGATALKLRDMTLVVSGGDPLDRQVDQTATTQVVNLLDELRRFIRERIEAEAAGRAVPR